MFQMKLKTLIPLVILVSCSGQSMAMSFSDARHLLARTGFGSPSMTEIEAILPLTYPQAVDHILDGVSTTAVSPPPVFQSSPLERKNFPGMTKSLQKDFNTRKYYDRQEVKYWWIKEMLYTPSPFTERMVLFWHNHFVSEALKVGFGQWLYEQNVIFRKYATGDFHKLITHVFMGPAMLMYLDVVKNKKDNPNENFAREILELFTLGEGQLYTENDIRESARAYTGWQVNFQTAQAAFLIDLHDNTNKTVFGKTGNFDAFDIIQLILDKPRVAEFLVEKLWREFVSLKPETVEIKRLANILRENHYNLKPVLKAIFMSDAFRNPKNRGSLIKSPVELTIGTLRLLEIQPNDYHKIWYYQKRAGQNLYGPPDVKGWRGGKSWISSITTLRRIQFLRAVINDIVRSKMATGRASSEINKLVFGKTNMKSLLRHHNSRTSNLENLLLAVRPVMRESSERSARNIIRDLLLDPAFQLK
jgi:uncharacterized protein (DUF1800 family)